jgi:hypothetical protein
VAAWAIFTSVGILEREARFGYGGRGSRRWGWCWSEDGGAMRCRGTAEELLLFAIDIVQLARLIIVPLGFDSSIAKFGRDSCECIQFDTELS